MKERKEFYKTETTTYGTMGTWASFMKNYPEPNREWNLNVQGQGSNPRKRGYPTSFGISFP